MGKLAGRVPAVGPIGCGLAGYAQALGIPAACWPETSRNPCRKKPMLREEILGPGWFALLFGIFAGVYNLLHIFDGVSDAGFSML